MWGKYISLHPICLILKCHSSQHAESKREREAVKDEKALTDVCY